MCIYIYIYIQLHSNTSLSLYIYIYIYTLCSRFAHSRLHDQTANDHALIQFTKKAYFKHVNTYMIKLSHSGFQ